MMLGWNGQTSQPSMRSQTPRMTLDWGASGALVKAALHGMPSNTRYQQAPDFRTTRSLECSPEQGDPMLHLCEWLAIGTMELGVLAGHSCPQLPPRLQGGAVPHTPCSTGHHGGLAPGLIAVCCIHPICTACAVSL